MIGALSGVAFQMPYPPEVLGPNHLEGILFGDAPMPTSSLSSDPFIGTDSTTLFSSYPENWKDGVGSPFEPVPSSLPGTLPDLRPFWSKLASVSRRQRRRNCHVTRVFTRPSPSRRITLVSVAIQALVRLYCHMVPVLLAIHVASLILSACCSLNITGDGLPSTGYQPDSPADIVDSWLIILSPPPALLSLDAYGDPEAVPMVEEMLEPRDSVILDPFFYSWTPGFHNWAPGLPLSGDFDPTLEASSLEVSIMDIRSSFLVLTSSSLESVIRKAPLQDVDFPSSAVLGSTLASVLLDFSSPVPGLPSLGGSGSSRRRYFPIFNSGGGWDEAVAASAGAGAGQPAHLEAKALWAGRDGLIPSYDSGDSADSFHLRGAEGPIGVGIFYL
jgi:hypothetical protein